MIANNGGKYLNKIRAKNVLLLTAKQGYVNTK